MAKIFERTHMRKIIMTAALGLLAAGGAWAAGTAAPAPTPLVGIGPVRVNIVKVPDELSGDGISTGLVKSEVEGIMAGGHVPTSDSSYPSLNIEVTAIKSSMGFYSFTVDGYVYDLVKKTESPNDVVPAAIWVDGSLGTADVSEIGPKMRASVDAIAAQFVSDYIYQNYVPQTTAPKK
jgi:hypothetical protein